MSLSSWFSGSTKAEEAILARLQRLQKDSRDWPSAIAELLEVAPLALRADHAHLFLVASWGCAMGCAARASGSARSARDDEAWRVGRSV